MVGKRPLKFIVHCNDLCTNCECAANDAEETLQVLNHIIKLLRLNLIQDLKQSIYFLSFINFSNLI